MKIIKLLEMLNFKIYKLTYRRIISSGDYFINFNEYGYIVNIFNQDINRSFQFKTEQEIIKFLKDEFKHELRKIKINKLLIN